LLPSVLLLYCLVACSHSVHALLHSFHPANHAQCAPMSCSSLAQCLLHSCNCIPRSHCGVPIPPSHSVVPRSHCTTLLRNAVVLHCAAMHICSVVLAQHFRDIRTQTSVYPVTAVTAQYYIPVYTRVCTHTVFSCQVCFKGNRRLAFYQDIGCA